MDDLGKFERQIIDFDDLKPGMFLLSFKDQPIYDDPTGCVVTRVDFIKRDFIVRDDRCNNCYTFSEEELKCFRLPQEDRDLTAEELKEVGHGLGSSFLHINWALFHNVGDNNW